MIKVRIVHPFHRFVDVVEGQREHRETYTLGQIVDVSEEDAADWIAKGLAVSADE